MMLMMEMQTPNRDTHSVMKTDMGLGVLEKLQLPPITVCAASVWPIMLELEEFGCWTGR